MAEAGYCPMPLTVEEISREWLTAALRQRAPGVTVESFEIVDVINTTTTKVRVRVRMDQAGRDAGIPELLIVKGGFQAHSRGMDHMHLREVRGYRDVYPEIPLPSPACYFADFDAERRQGIIIMEDLVARGVEWLNAVRPQSYEQVAERLTVLAEFHAATWDSPELEPGGKWGDLVDFFDVMQGFFEDKASPANWARFCALPRGVAMSTRFHDRELMLKAWDRTDRYAHTLPHCVLHGDVHLGNLYIDVDGTPGFLDTLASRGPGMLEVSYHISASVDQADRADWEVPLVRHYLDALAAAGAKAPSIEEAMHQYAVFLTYGWFIWMTTESAYQPEVVNTANSARMSQAMLDHDLIGVINQLS